MLRSFLHGGENARLLAVHEFCLVVIECPSDVFVRSLQLQQRRCNSVRLGLRFDFESIGLEHRSAEDGVVHARAVVYIMLASRARVVETTALFAVLLRRRRPSLPTATLGYLSWLLSLWMCFG